MKVGEPNVKAAHVRKPGRPSTNTFPDASIIHLKIIKLKDLIVEYQAGTDPALLLHPRHSDLLGALLDDLHSAPSHY
jgi:hypothetical protein